MIAVTRTTMTLRAERLANLLFIFAELYSHAALLISETLLPVQYKADIFVENVVLAVAAQPDAQCVISSHLAYIASVVQED